MPYEINYKGWVHQVDGSNIVNRFVCDSRSRFGDRPGMEDQLTRLTDIVGRIADAAGINLLTLIESHEIKDFSQLKFVAEIDESKGDC